MQMQIVVGNWSYEFNRDLGANDEIKVKQYNIKGRPDYNYYVYTRVKGLPILSNPSINPISLTSQWLSRKRGTRSHNICVF